MLKVVMTNGKLVELKKVLEEIKTLELNNVKFNYVMSKNLKLFSDEVAYFESLVKPSEKFIEYETKRINALKTKYAITDENGQPILENNQFKVKEELLNEFIQYMNELNIEYKEAIEERLKTVNEFEKLMEDEVSESIRNNIVIFKYEIDEDNIPKNLPEGLKQKHLDQLLDYLIKPKNEIC